MSLVVYVAALASGGYLADLSRAWVEAHADGAPVETYDLDALIAERDGWRTAATQVAAAYAADVPAPAALPFTPPWGASDDEAY
jgi:hypothetical protein